MKQFVMLCFILFCLDVAGQDSYKIFSSATNLSLPKGKGGYVDADGNKLVILCDQTYDICAIKLDPTGALMWAKKYKVPSTEEDVTPFVIEMGEYYYLVGNTGYPPYGIDALVLKISKSDGLCVLAKKYGGVSGDTFNGASLLTDNTFLVCGYTLNPTFVPTSGILNKGDGIIVELDENLDTLRTVRIGAYNRFDRFDRLLKTSDGQIVALGVKSPPNGSASYDNEDLTIVRLTSSLTPLWARTYHQPVSTFEQPCSLLEGVDGSLWVVSRLLVVDKTSVMKLRSNSGALLTKTTLDQFTALDATFVGGKLLVAGQKNSTAGGVAAIDTSSLGFGFGRSYSFGSSSFVNIQSLKKFGGAVLDGFGSSHGATKALWFSASLDGSIGACDGVVGTGSTSPLVVDTTRTFAYMVGKFPYAGQNVTVVTETIGVSATECFPTPLATTLVAFEAEALPAQQVGLRWTTAGENADLMSFVVEASTDGESFEGVGEVTASSGYTSSYTWRGHRRPNESYYRLRLVYENREELSDVVWVGLQEEILIYPNPAHDHVNIGSDRKALLLDSFGRVVIEGLSSETNLTSIPAGVYSVWFPEQSTRLTLMVKHP